MAAAGLLGPDLVPDPPLLPLTLTLLAVHRPVLFEAAQLLTVEVGDAGGVVDAGIHD